MAWYETAGKTIEELRKSQRMTQKDLAERLGVQRDAVKDWECFYRKPSVEMLMKLSRIFDVTVDYLIGKSDSRLPADHRITVLTNRFGFSAKAAKEITVLSIPENGEWAKKRFEALNRLLEETDLLEGFLVGVYECLHFGEMLTYYQAELLKEGRYPGHSDGFCSEEELFIDNDRNTWRSATIFKPQYLMAKIAERFVEESEKNYTAPGDTTESGK